MNELFSTFYILVVKNSHGNILIALLQPAVLTHMHFGSVICNVERNACVRVFA